ncbi:hypothetical protein [Rhodococcus zopfii]|uniref:hypothetical protein n=1 Tax=Rhodococcus zopfii TaxID=43772 RepID=UPI000933FEF0|nr:hypothetical protein [Rhodococcus zopfii]
MTTPGQNAPDGAWQFGDRMGQEYTGMTTADVIAMMTGQARSDLNTASNGWNGVVFDLNDIRTQFQDGQLELNERTELLEGVSGYCQVFMSKNWNVVQNQLITLPFDAQLGPEKGAFPHGGNGIRLATRGLWRADLHVTADKMTNSNFQAEVYVSVMNLATGLVFTEHQYDMVLTPSGSETASFSITFVIPDDNNYVVRARVKHNRTNRLKIFGGTVRSALSVNKWDNRTTNALVLDEAPDGGDLG